MPKFSNHGDTDKPIKIKVTKEMMEDAAARDKYFKSKDKSKMHKKMRIKYD